tara:strand:+ start:534 stop:722 length:189 start_codon:yes stop_codon:yes gene_type:complete
MMSSEEQGKTISVRFNAEELLALHQLRGFISEASGIEVSRHRLLKMMIERGGVSLFEELSEA